MKPLLSALLLLALFAPMPAQALSDRDHQRYLQECPAYREADRQINEAWKKLKGFCGKERFREELAEQRSWLKNRDSMTEDARRQGEDTASAAARVMLERVAILNCKICQFDPSWVTFSIQYDV
ncbi:MAG: hypothetical protein Q4F72_11815, partial [Desulfovibrionaceae bacterium]|nr:hypothetical protein [Desulfovibrionaceae bacterium]